MWCTLKTRWLSLYIFFSATTGWNLEEKMWWINYQFTITLRPIDLLLSPWAWFIADWFLGHIRTYYWLKPTQEIWHNRTDSIFSASMPYHLLTYRWTDFGAIRNSKTARGSSYISWAVTQILNSQINLNKQETCTMTMGLNQPLSSYTSPAKLHQMKSIACNTANTM